MSQQIFNKIKTSATTVAVLSDLVRLCLAVADKFQASLSWSVELFRLHWLQALPLMQLGCQHGSSWTVSEDFSA